MDVGSSERARKLFERVIDIVTSDIVQGQPNSVLHTPPPHRDTPVDPCPISMCILHGYSFYNLCLSISILTPVANGLAHSLVQLTPIMSRHARLTFF